MKFYLTGQTNFGNRGCEALVRSIVALTKQKYPDASFFCPSNAPHLDKLQWLQTTQQNVTLTNVPEFPQSLRWWARGCRVLPALESFARPNFSPYENCIEDMRSADASIVSALSMVIISSLSRLILPSAVRTRFHESSCSSMEKVTP